MQEQYDYDLSQIRSACKSGDLAGLEKTVEAIEQQWNTMDSPLYISLLRSACDEIASCRFSDMERARSLIEKLATIALAKADEDQIENVLHLLVSYLQIDYKFQQLERSEWAKARGESASLWLSLWRKVEGGIDRHWDPDDPQNYVKPYVPSANVPFRAGMSPEAIQDPKIRAEYESHLKKNAQIAAKNNQQRRLRKLKEQYSDRVADYIIKLYKQPPRHMKELEKMLVDLEDTGMRQRILNAVSAKATRP